MLGTNELLVLFVIGFALILPIATAIWVYRDATERNNKDAAIWTVGSLIAWPLVAIVYLIVRPDRRTSSQ